MCGHATRGVKVWGGWLAHVDHEEGQMAGREGVGLCIEIVLETGGLFKVKEVLVWAWKQGKGRFGQTSKKIRNKKVKKNKTSNSDHGGVRFWRGWEDGIFVTMKDQRQREGEARDLGGASLVLTIPNIFNWILDGIPKKGKKEWCNRQSGGAQIRTQTQQRHACGGGGDGARLQFSHP